ncbi:MAG TPA: AI-2E family transporter [Kofleriaceae bacterium]|nr:AI-2E family transporter [Kofleriaceae bacterium]
MATGIRPSEPDDVVESAPEHRALAWAAAASFAAILWLVRPIGLGILLGVLLAFLAQPACKRLSTRIGERLAVVTTVVAAGLGVAVTLGGLGWLFVARGTVLASELVAAVGPRGLIDRVAGQAGVLTQRFGLSSDDVREHVRGLAGAAAHSAEQLAAAIASATAHALLGLFFAMLTMHYILRNGERISKVIPNALPLRPAYTAALGAEFRRVGRSTLRGSIVTAIVQGIIAAIGYWITGVPEPIFFGAATAIASFVPLVGVMIVIVPASIGLALAGHVAAGIVELVWGIVLVVGVPDYVIRPRLVRGEAKVPAVVTFASLFGGVEVFGLAGLLVGPVLMALAIAVLRLYAAEMTARRRLEDPEGMRVACLIGEPTTENVMATTTGTGLRSQSEKPRDTHHWGVPMTIGVLLIIGGTFALFASFLTSIVSVIYIGIMLVAVGLFEIISAFRVRHAGPFFAYFLAGLLAVVVGGLFLYRPMASIASLTLLIAGYMSASGLFRGINALADRYPGWGWDVAYGVVAVALGIYVAASWPLSSYWVLGTVVAVEVIARGITLLAASWTLRDIDRGIPGAAAAG